MNSLADLIEQHAQRTPQQIAVRCVSARDGQAAAVFDYATLWRRIERISGHLCETWRIAPGDRVACLGFNHELQISLLFACMRVGAMLAPLNIRLALPELAAIVQQAGVRVLWFDEAHRTQAEALQERLAGQHALEIGSIRDLVTHPSPKGLTYVPADPHTPALLAYTSGTTGEPKGAMHTQAALLANAQASWWAHDMTAADHVLSVLPLFHVGGLCIQTLPALLCGASVTLHARFDAAGWLDAVRTDRPTLSLMVPATLRAVLGHAGWADADLSSLRGVMAGSSVVPRAYIDAFHERGVPLGQVYGATETGPVSIVLKIARAMRKPGSTGVPCPGVEIRLVRHGKDVAPGEVGEIWVRGANLMQGYWGASDHPAFVDGWFHSGDLARCDAEGDYEVVGRSKEMIISGGENIYPAEIENWLVGLPGVAECAVIGVPDERSGEVPVAVLSLHQAGSLDADAVLAFLGERIARYKLPRRIVFLPTLPKSALGKVQKAALRDELARH
ncbi:AMP-binding protein [Pandoraea sp.]|uniref:class I adenylate-forming enzyme family protein n=1 Tax=Pandoraea sp. TaxID=1883445 RepID=UPI00121E759D|nr:AMP-binding protein [Pandoraea sp.]TAL55663.1 MAG: long-chain fatty acid--CoA ligase [Pandoraea sp.]TAM16832.1 MAG: long-chain fatty acid--CoA ligase [Pandoraea sp.]